MSEQPDELVPLCLAPSTSRWNFLRTWYCSRPAGHSPETPHEARDEHRPDGDLVWVGPWADGTYYEVPEDSGLVPWTADMGRNEAP